MRKNIVVIGISSFGYYVCKYLSELNVNVLAIDKNEKKINDLENIVYKGVIANAKDKSVLENLQLEEYDTIVVSVGEEIETSVLITLHLKELGVKDIITKANTVDHAKILNILGANTIVFPERDSAQRLAHTLHRRSLLDYFSLGDDFSIIEIATPDSWNGKSLISLDIRKNFGVQIILIKELLPQNVQIIPQGDHILKDSDILTILGKNADIEKIENLK